MKESQTSECSLNSVLNKSDCNNILHNLINHDHLAYIQLNTDLKITFWDSNAQEMFGYSEEESLGLFLSDIVNEEEKRINHFNFLFNILSNPENKSDTNSNVNKNGDEVLCEWFYSPILDEKKKISGISAISKNITRSVNLEKELKSSQNNNLQDIFEKAPIGIYQADLEGRFTSVNPELAWMLGYESSEVLIEEMTDMASQLFVDEEKCGEFFFTLFEAEQLNHFKSEIKRKDDSTFWAFSNAQITKDEEGRKKGFSGFLIDINNTVKAEKALKKSKEIAEDATRTKSEFLANMSHEIRTPLNAIIGFSDLVLQTDLNKRQYDYIKKSGIAGRALLGIINDILDFSKIEAGKMDLDNSEFMLHELLNNIVDMFSSKIAEQGIELIVSVAPNVPVILVGDSLRLGQVLINLINNSIKFTGSGEVIVWVSCLKTEDDLVTLQFSVSDTGIGMTPEQQTKLFSSFSQADASTTRKFGGTGLGLTISKKLIEMMNGKIWVKSQDNEGSVFSCIADLGYQTQESIDEVPDDLIGKKILIQNENAAFREVFMMLLMYFSFSVHTVASKEELFELLENSEKNHKPYDLMIMSKIHDEYEYLEKINAMANSEKIKNIPVIITADFGQDEIEDSEVNVSNVIVKPVKQTELINVIMEIFGHKPLFESLADVEEEKEKESIKKLNNSRILLVEDNEINQEVAYAILSKKGIITDIANNGLEAVNIIKKIGLEKNGDEIILPYDTILMDIQMPEMDGYEATTTIRGWEKELNLPEDCRPMPIIAMSAHALATEIEKCTEAGMNSYVAKPIDTKVLFAELCKWVIRAESG